MTKLDLVLNAFHECHHWSDCSCYAGANNALNNAKVDRNMRSDKVTMNLLASHSHQQKPDSRPPTLENQLKRHPGVHLTALPHQDGYYSRLQGVTLHPREKPVQEEDTLRKAPEWVEHIPTQSKHKFTIRNLGQSEQVLRQFYGGANGGKPYVTPNANKVTSKAEKDIFDNKEAREIAERIIKQELNRAKVAKFGRSGGTTFETNEKNARLTVLSFSCSEKNKSFPPYSQPTLLGKFLNWNDEKNMEL
ncbi:hypothetical protein COOONC_02970 [Cooperia oncophora]